MSAPFSGYFRSLLQQAIQVVVLGFSDCLSLLLNLGRGFGLLRLAYLLLCHVSSFLGLLPISPPAGHPGRRPRFQRLPQSSPEPRARIRPASACLPSSVPCQLLARVTSDLSSSRPSRSSSSVSATASVFS